MEFRQSSLADAWVIEPRKFEDERGYFTRLRCAAEFREMGLPEIFVQTNVSYNAAAGTFRGLHYQVPPSREGKLVRCIAGAVDDVIVDLRPDSTTYLEHEWFRLDSRGLSALFVPTGFAHGFRTLADATVVLYEMTDFYEPTLSRGLRWNDPALGIRIDEPINVINPRDADYPDLNPDDLQCFAGVRP